MAIMCAAIYCTHVPGSSDLSRTEPNDRTRNFAELAVEDPCLDTLELCKENWDIISRYLESRACDIHVQKAKHALAMLSIMHLGLNSGPLLVEAFIVENSFLNSHKHRGKPTTGNSNLYTLNAPIIYDT